MSAIAAFPSRPSSARAPAGRAGPSRKGRPPWVVVLAGGEGRRLNDLTTDSHGTRVPKQFCRFHADRSLLRMTLDRGLGLTDAEHLVAVVVEEHRRWWQSDLVEVAARNVLVQPEGRGTGVAILHALVHICLHDPDAVLVVLPSDHDVEREDILRGATLRAVRIARSSPGKVVLLGTTPAAPDADYGWIVPGDSRGDGACMVEFFVEKPRAADFELLRKRGALCNTFIVVASVRALCQRYVREQPSLFKAFMGRLRWGTGDRSILGELHAAAPTLDFGRNLLEGGERSLLMLPVPPCGWADLGTLPHLEAWVRHRQAARDRPAPVLLVPDEGDRVRAIALRSSA
jgi:mannose-1-phosphate guanylyltransferase